MNPTSSVKDRIGFNLIEDGVKKGVINKDTIIIEPTSGNTGIALASICASLGYKLILTMPESMSIERRKILKHLGAEVVLSSEDKGMNGAIDKAKELNQKIENSIILQQFENPANPAIHKITTAEEILRDTDGNIDIFVTSIGTGGTLVGIAELLKEKIPNIKIVALEPKNSAVLSGKKRGLHKIQGIGAGFIPEIINNVNNIYDEILTISDEEAILMSKRLAKEEGLLVGISSGANVVGAMKLASRKENDKKNIVTILCDTGERYLSTDLF
jgi:cysteine synthase A